MLYPLRFIPVYKDYPWGGRGFERFGRTLPAGIVAESWEISGHPDGVSVVSGGEYAGQSLPSLLERFGRDLAGHALPDKDIIKFPLLVKFIDANQNLSVQVHPDDEYACRHENGEYGKNEMWYILSADPGAKLVYGIKSGVTRTGFEKAVAANAVLDCLEEIPVSAGDVLNIPSGLVHAIGSGIMIAEIQQNSNTTYRIYDYGRRGRALHMEKALNVIDFENAGKQKKTEGLPVRKAPGLLSRYLVANRFFCTELYAVDGTITETADGSRFYAMVVLEGEGRLVWETGVTCIKGGESLLLPATLGNYTLSGRFSALKSYVPDLEKNVVRPLITAGYDMDAISSKVAGLAKEPGIAFL